MYIPLHGFKLKKKFRWVAAFYLDNKEIQAPQFVTVHPNPNWIEETELDFLLGKKLDPKVETISILISHERDNHPTSYFDKVVLGLFDGCGGQIEEWEVLNCEVTDYDTDEQDDDPYAFTKLTVAYRGCHYKSVANWTKELYCQPVSIQNQVTIE